MEIELPANLLCLAAQVAEKNQPDAGQLLSGLQQVRVYVVGLDDSNRAEVQKRTQTIRQELLAKGWQRIVGVQEKSEEVGIYLKMADKGAIQGLVATVLDGKDQAVFVNVVGDIKPEQLAALGDHLKLDALKNFAHFQKKAHEKVREGTPQKAEDKPAPKAEN